MALILFVAILAAPGFFLAMAVGCSVWFSAFIGVTWILELTLVLFVAAYIWDTVSGANTRRIRRRQRAASRDRRGF